MDTASEIARRLLQIKAIRLNPQNPFTWASGIQSPIYCDNRITLSYPEVRNFIKKSFAESSLEFGTFDLIAGVATAGIPHGALLADALNKPFIYIRSKPKEHGRKNQIEGFLPENSSALVIEDLISTGGSSLRAVETLRELGCEVKGVLAIFTYELETARKAFESANCRLLTLSNFSTLIQEALESGHIDRDSIKVLLNWRENPHLWGRSLQQKQPKDI